MWPLLLPHIGYIQFIKDQLAPEVLVNEVGDFLKGEGKTWYHAILLKDDIRITHWLMLTTNNMVPLIVLQN